ncbi:MAG: hypothetical protein QG632_528 [Candidatus Dependentiae bacterium]|nr:hypothetical protein [Candidatus Dependentiae bacterium]
MIQPMLFLFIIVFNASLSASSSSLDQEHAKSSPQTSAQGSNSNHASSANAESPVDSWSRLKRTDLEKLQELMINLIHGLKGTIWSRFNNMVRYLEDTYSTRLIPSEMLHFWFYLIEGKKPSKVYIASLEKTAKEVYEKIRNKLEAHYKSDAKSYFLIPNVTDHVNRPQPNWFSALPKTNHSLTTLQMYSRAPLTTFRQAPAASTLPNTQIRASVHVNEVVPDAPVQQEVVKESPEAIPPVNDQETKSELLPFEPAAKREGPPLDEVTPGRSEQDSTEADVVINNTEIDGLSTANTDGRSTSSALYTADISDEVTLKSPLAIEQKDDVTINNAGANDSADNTPPALASGATSTPELEKKDYGKWEVGGGAAGFALAAALFKSVSPEERGAVFSRLKSGIKSNRSLTSKQKWAAVRMLGSALATFGATAVTAHGLYTMATKKNETAAGN